MTEPSFKTSRADTSLTNDELAAGAALLKAAAGGNLSGIDMAKRAGADPTTLYPDPENNGSRVTAVWHCIRTGSASYLMYMIGSGQSTVPLAYENEKEGAVGLFDAMAAMHATDMSNYINRWPEVQRCFDFSALEVAHRAWDMADKMLTPKAPATRTQVNDFVYGERILALGAIPDRGTSAWEQLLSRHVGLYQSGEKVVSMATGMMTSLDCASFVRRILADGVDPNLRIHGVPLLHHAAPSKVPELPQQLIEAGASVDATCTREQFLEVFASRLESIDQQALSNLGQAVTASDAARLLGNMEQVHVIQTYRAKGAIDAILKGARAHGEP